MWGQQQTLGERWEKIEARHRASLARAERAVLAAGWARAQRRVTFAMMRTKDDVGRGAEAEYIAERARCEGLIDTADRRRKARRGVQVGGAQLAEEARARVWLDGVRAAERAAAAEWPPCLRLLLVRLARET